jgi:hypothetical protein
MLEVALLPLSPAVEPAVLALNNAHAAELSWLDRDRLTLLLRQAFHARRIGEVDGFLLAFDQSAAYDSPNYLWFRQRYRRFVYVDRVVVAPAARGRATRACCTPICSTAPAGPDTISSSARSTAIRRTQPRTPSMQRRALPKWARPRSTTGARRSAISPA